MNKRFLNVLLFSALGFTACGDADDESPDGRDDVAFADGKADSLFGDCEATKLLELLNDPSTTKADLAGVHGRAAGNIIKKRNGDDETAGTADDFLFETVIEVDKVPFVGPVAMNQLASLIGDQTCDDPVVAGEAEVIFSPQPFEDSHLKRVATLIDGAEESIDIAMYSFSDAGIMNSLEDAVDRGVSVRLIFESANKDKKEPAGTKSAKLEDMGIDVRYINKIMHHKYAIIDGPREVLGGEATDKGIVATGSGNWSNSAGTRYDENTVILFGNAELNMKFQQEFNHLWANSRDFVHTQTFDFFESDTIEDDMIPDDPALETAFTSANFRTFVSSRFGPTFSVIRGENEIADKIVEHINAATDSIHIASGHLRSRSVTEALIAKAAANPAMDIKVYLDGQEYVSSFANREEKKKREACLDKAGTSEAKQQDCLDKGYHYAFDVKEANIPMRFKYYAYRWHFSYAVQMHHKYIIIDGDTVISGSYNLSDNAEHNTMENIVVYKSSGFPDLVEAFKQNFEEIWNTGEGKLEGLLDEIENSSKVPIVFDSMAITWSEVNNLKRTIARECPEVNSTEFRRNAERHHNCFK